MVIRIAALFALTIAPVFCADWNPRLAADYLDARQKAWFAWPTANKGENGVCLSCHTGLTYMLARPVLSHTLGENAATPYETGILDNVRKRLSKKTTQEYSPNAKEPGASQGLGVEAILATMLLASEDARHGALSKETEQAFDRLWALQLTDGKDKGAWSWNSLGYDPWEEPNSMFYGAALAAVATATAPEGYQARSAIRENVAAMKAYLSSQQQTQPLHNRLMAVWASSKMKGVLSESERKAILTEVFKKQLPDGGWTVESMGAWTAHPAAPAAEGSNAYVTALTAFVLQRSGVSATNNNLARSLDWLRAHQDPGTGTWAAQSMNKKYAAGSMPLDFMRDAATSYASIALAESAADTRRGTN